MKPDLSKWGPVTVLVVAVVLIVVIAGAVVTITSPHDLPFKAYLAALVGAAGSAGLLGIGRGLHKGLADLGLAVNLPGQPIIGTDAPANHEATVKPDRPDKGE